MGNIFTLDSLREEAEKEFAPVEIVVSDGSTVTLRNLLRLPKKEREVVLGKLRLLDKAENDSESDDVDNIGRMAELAGEILEVVADNGGKLVKELGDDVTVILKVLSVWMGSSQPGEAEPSPSS